MKHKYKIRVDQPVPDDDQIDRHKNFDGLLANYQNLTKPLYRRPLYKNPKTFIGLLLIIVVAVLVFQAVEEEEKEIDQAEQVLDAEEKGFLTPPVLSLAALAETKQVTPGLEAEFPLQEGTVLHIPAGAFAGREHPLEIKVVRYPNPLAAVLNGIPLVDSRGMNLNPLRILSIEARCQGEEIGWDENSPLWIGDNSPEAGKEEALAAFVLDMEKRNWRPATGTLTMEQKVVKTPISTHLDDGFGVVEIDENGNQKPRDPGARDRGTVRTKASWVQRAEIVAPGLHLFGTQSNVGNADQLVQLLDQEGKPLEVQALHQVVEGTIRTAWPRSNGQFKLVSEPCLLFGFLPDGRPVRMDWEVEVAQEEPLALVPKVADTAVTNQTALEAFLFNGE